MIGFGKFGKKRELEIVSLADERLVLIDPTVEGFFDKVLGYECENEKINSFIEAVEEVKDEKIGPFWKPIFDPSMDSEKIVFKAGGIPAVGKSFTYWKKAAENLSLVEGKKWHVGTEYRYYTFLIWLINRLTEKDLSIENALEAVVVNSKSLGHYYNSENSVHELEKTGKRPICGVCDLANAFKMLAATNNRSNGESKWFWNASGSYGGCSDVYPLADLNHNEFVDYNFNSGVGWLVLY